LADYLDIDEDLQKKFPGLAAQILLFRDVNVKRESPQLKDYKEEVYREINHLWTLDGLKDDPVFRAYRDFFWRLGIDPTKNSPAAEALIRRTLRGNPIPRINTWVDAYNLVSMLTAIPIASFDSDKLSGDLLMREARQGEEFMGIGMKSPVTLSGGEAVIEDASRLIAIYPYRDADYSKVTMATRNVYMLMCGAPEISLEKLSESSEQAVKLMLRFCDGSIKN
jgi:DNA/RNA-binding domain of Phe-tRNA-synthetase-like protein